MHQIKINLLFFDSIRDLAEKGSTDYVLICGDLNLVLDSLKDCYNYTNVNNPRSRQKVVDLITELELVDVYRYLYPNQKRYTWRKKTQLNKQDLIIIDKCSINPGYHSDHSILELQISINTFKQGKGLWKFNNSLLKDEN